MYLATLRPTRNAVSYTLKNLVKKNFSLWFALYASAHHDARVALCDTQTFVENEVLVPKNPFLTILFFCKIGILYPLPIKIGTSSIGLNKKILLMNYIAYVFIVIFTAVQILRMKKLLVVMIKRVCIVIIY